MMNAKITSIRSDVGHSTGSRLALLLASAAIIWMNARILGPEGQGFVALFSLGVLTISSAGAFIAGGAVVYLQQRINLRDAWWPGVLWLAGVATAVGILGYITEWLPVYWAIEIAVAGFVQGLIIFHAQLALAVNRVALYNVVTAGQTTLLALFLATCFYGLGWRMVDAWVMCLEVTLVLTLMTSCKVFRTLGRPRFRLSSDLWQLLWSYGRLSASGGLLQMWTNRANISILERTGGIGLSGAGVYSVAYYGVEAIWAFSRGLAPVLHSRVASMHEEQEERLALTLKFTRWSIWVTLPLSLIAAGLPDKVYLAIFGFPGIANVLRALFPLMLTGAVCSVWAHHLSGVGGHKWNAWSSGAGFLLLCALAPVGIAEFGVSGAAIVASLAGGIQLLGLGLGLAQTEKIRLLPWLFSRSSEQ